MKRIPRFTGIQRLFHLLLMLAFVIQAMTGAARMYIETEWGRSLARLFGGADSVLRTHRYTGLFMLALFVLHLLYILARLRGTRLTGPDSLVPGMKDVRQFFQHVGWMLGMGSHPRFDRWTYWEKFDYWAVFWGMVIIGGTGLLLYSPVVSSRYMPGWGLNVALWVHRIEAILAVGHIVLIHFVIAHLRRSAFPMDRSMFEGSVPEEHVRLEKPAWLERLRGSGAQAPEAAPAPAGARALALLFGWAVVLALGVFFFTALANAPGVTW